MSMPMIRELARNVKRAGRALAGSDVFYRPDVRCPRMRAGDDGAAFCVCPGLLSPTSAVYSFGIGSNISFDLALVSRFALHVHAFDPTPRSLAWVRAQQLPEKFHVHPIGIAAFDGQAGFRPPQNPSHVSYTMVPDAGAQVQASVCRLATIMTSLGHQSLDLLKLDIEGGEYTVLADLLASKIPVRQICVEFHHRWPEIGIAKTIQAVDQLRRAGYRIFDVSASGEEFSFVGGR